MSESLVLKKSYAFAIRVINLYRVLRSRRAERALMEQLLRSGTSITANLSEAVYAHSPAEYVAKVRIALKEASESQTWLRLFHDTGTLSDAEFRSIEADCTEILKMLSATIRTLQNKRDE